MSWKTQTPTGASVVGRDGPPGSAARTPSRFPWRRGTPSTGGRINQVYSWASPDGPICIKVDERWRAQRERRALTRILRVSPGFLE